MMRFDAYTALYVDSWWIDYHQWTRSILQLGHWLPVADVTSIGLLFLDWAADAAVQFGQPRWRHAAYWADLDAETVQLRLRHATRLELAAELVNSQNDSSPRHHPRSSSTPHHQKEIVKEDNNNNNNNCLTWRWDEW